MIGKPKYNYKDIVKFEIDGEMKQGQVYIIDKYGTFFDDSDVCYDIFVESENMLYKHVNERFVSSVND